MGDILDYADIAAVMRRVEEESEDQEVAYIEAQFHRGVGLESVQEFIFYDEQPRSKKAMKAVAKKKIGFRVVK